MRSWMSDAKAALRKAKRLAAAVKKIQITQWYAAFLVWAAALTMVVCVFAPWAVVLVGLNATVASVVPAACILWHFRHDLLRFIGRISIKAAQLLVKFLIRVLRWLGPWPIALVLIICIGVVNRLLESPIVQVCGIIMLFGSIQVVLCQWMLEGIGDGDTDAFDGIDTDCVGAPPNSDPAMKKRD